MFSAAVQIVENFKAVEKAVADASFRNISHAAASLRKDAVGSIEPGEGPSTPGTPPHTHTQKITKKGKTRKGVYPRAIAFVVDKAKEEAIIGPQFSKVGESFHAHEFGESFHGESFPERPTMGPALDRAAPRFGDSFAGSLGG